MNEQSNVNHDDLLEKATEALRQTPISAGPPRDLVADVVARLEREEVTDKVQPRSLFGRFSAMTPMTRLTIVATLAVFFFGLFAWFSPRGRVFALSDVAQALGAIKSATCDMTSETRGMKNYFGVMFLAPSLERIEMKMGHEVMSITIADIRAKKWLSLMPQQKIAMVLKMDDAPADRPMNGSFELIRERFRKAQANPAGGSRSLGEKEIDGVRAVGFRLDDETGSTDVWAHPETALPIRVETTFPTEPKVTVVMTNFQYDVELDESLFSFDPPDDYTIRESDVNFSPPSINDLADMLRFAAENNEGVFPEELTGAKGVHFVMQKLLDEVKNEHGQDSPEWKNAVVEYSTRIARGNAFVMTEHPQSVWHYQGGGAKLGDAKTAIYWFRPKDSQTWQVLYGDLRIEQGVAETDLPERHSETQR